MFTLRVADHVRLDSEHVARNYTLHARAAERLAAAVLAIKLVILALLVVATAASVADLLFQVRADRIAAIVASSFALVGFVFYAVLGLEARVMAHRTCAQRLWLVSERYRSLMTELEEGFVDRPALLRRRDELISQLHIVYEGGFSADQNGYETERLTLVASDRPSDVQAPGALSPG